MGREWRRRPMIDQSKTWLCPACGKRVHEHRPFVAAIEGEDGADFGFDGDPLWLRPVAFTRITFNSGSAARSTWSWIASHGRVRVSCST